MPGQGSEWIDSAKRKKKLMCVSLVYQEPLFFCTKNRCFFATAFLDVSVVFLPDEKTSEEKRKWQINR